MGVYTQIKDNLLYTFFDSMCKSDEGVDDLGFKTNEGIKHLEELMTGIRYSELYKIFFKMKKSRFFTCSLEILIKSA